MNSNVRVGTSGWAYPHWRGNFYPSRISNETLLGYYAEHLSCVETNSTFYRQPTPETLSRWCEQVPAGFVFAVKASRYITHMKKLKDPGATVPGFLQRISALRERLGPILFQLPPRWRVDEQRLHALLKVLPADYVYAFEFRDPSWHCDAVKALLEDYGAAMCIFEIEHYRSPEYIAAGTVYVRLHGPAGAYIGSYSERELANWSSKLSAWSEDHDHVYCFFDNDEAGHAVRDALRLQQMLQGRT